MGHENKSPGNNDYPFVETLDKMAKFAHQDEADQTDRTQRNGRQPDVYRTSHNEPYRQYRQNDPAADRRRDERIQAGNERRREERIQAGNDRCRDERIQAGNEYRRDERIQAGNEYRREERFQAGNEHRREERIPTGNEYRRDERFQAGNDRRRDERIQAGNEYRRDERIQAGNEYRREERIQADNERRRDERIQAGNDRRRDERIQAGNDRRRDERIQAGNDRRRDERIQAGNDRRRDERIQAGNDRRRDERIQADNERRRDERIQVGNDRRRDERIQASNEHRRDERIQAGNEHRRDERFQAGNDRRREERFPAEKNNPQRDDRARWSDDRRVDAFPTFNSVEERTVASGIHEKREKRNKRPVALLCVLGAAVLVVITVWAVIRGGSGNRGVLPDGKSVKYAAVSPSDGSEKAAGETAATQPPPQSDQSMVRVTDYAPTVRVDLKYAGKRNFTGKRIYEFEDAYLRYGTVKKLIKAQKSLKEYGMGLMIWDAYRPHAAQKKLWEICPNPLYVKDPSKGYSDHTRGSAVDVTLVDSDGTELLMPTGFDNFTKLADRDYNDIDNDFARDNVKLLEKTMKAAGFQAYSEEWWHFTDSDSYDVAKDFVPES